jgi:CHAT domain
VTVDTEDLGSFLARFLPSLLDGGDQAARDAEQRFGLPAWEAARALWAVLREPMRRKPGLQQALLELKERPDNQGALTAFVNRLAALLRENQDLDQRVESLWERSRAGTLVDAEEQGPGEGPTRSLGSYVDDLLEAGAPDAPRFGLDEDVSDAADAPPAALGEDIPSAVPPAPPPRWLTASVADHDAAKPLRIGEPYTVAFSVELKQSRGSGEEPLPEQLLFAPGERMVELVVAVSSRDLMIETPEPQRLRIPRRGRSRNKARFDVVPVRKGVGELTASFYKDNNFVQGMVVRLNVEEVGPAIAGVVHLGRPVDGAFAVQPRDLSLVIRRSGDGFDLIFIGAVQAEIRLPLTPQYLDRLIDNLRKALEEIVYLAQTPNGVRPVRRRERLPAAGKLVYQEGIDIPTEVNQEAMRRLAGAGWDLYHELFYAGNDPARVLVGNRLRELARQETLKLQIVSKEFLFPWGALYLAERVEAERIDPECFLGFRHIIEHIPLQQQLTALDHRIRSEALQVSFNLDTGIDRAMRGLQVVRSQLDYSDELRRRNVQVINRTTRDEVQQALANQSTKDQILYFYCHAVSLGLSDPGGSYLKLTGKEPLTLQELTRSTSGQQLPGHPLVVINACQSAQLSPLFYGGFLPYFVDRGARGMVGTECDVPAVFADEWAKRFFDWFLIGGRTLGQVLLALRRQFYEEHNNLLGILYALYCDADTQVVPGVRAAPSM